MLVRCLATDRDHLERAIGAYAARRQERTAALQAAARNAGHTMHLSDPAEVAARNARMLANPEVQIAGQDWIWGYDVESAVADVQARPPVDRRDG